MLKGSLGGKKKKKMSTTNEQKDELKASMMTGREPQGAVLDIHESDEEDIPEG